MTLDQIMALADDYAEAFSDNAYQQDQGARPAVMDAAYTRCEVSRAALMAAVQSVLPTPADTGPIIP